MNKRMNERTNYILCILDGTPVKEQDIKIRTYILNDCIYCWSLMSVDILCCEEDEI